MSVPGFEDITEARFSNPRLTTVAADLDVLAREALRLLLRRVDGADGTAERIARALADPGPREHRGSSRRGTSLVTSA